MSSPKDAAWETGPCDCAECTEMPDTWCCRYCHSLSAGRTLPPARDHVAEQDALRKQVRG